ncbi:hypothetical protein AGLY_001979 [Aphis glycines]|uniref:Uncharacterized protein n=1 Tax=Aphis glycines TaxID=307491 RepID=A0A6G0U415_APHGL|nr:hypothetical protein AGLY_001979 [Aphis glycines]
MENVISCKHRDRKYCYIYYNSMLKDKDTKETSNIDKDDYIFFIFCFLFFFFFNKKLNIFNKQNAIISSIKIQKKILRNYRNLNSSLKLDHHNPIESEETCSSVFSASEPRSCFNDSTHDLGINVPIICKIVFNSTCEQTVSDESYCSFQCFSALDDSTLKYFFSSSLIFGRNMVNIISFLEGVFVVSPFLLALLSANKASTAIISFSRCFGFITSFYRLFPTHTSFDMYNMKLSSSLTSGMFSKELCFEAQLAYQGYGLGTCLCCCNPCLILSNRLATIDAKRLSPAKSDIRKIYSGALTWLER